MGPDRLPLPDADVALDRGFLEAAEARSAFATLHAEVAWQEARIRLFGRAVPLPRLIAFHGDAGRTYAWSGLVLGARAWTPLLAALRRRVEDATDARFDCVLLNLYRDGRDGVAWHADDEAALGPEPVIASLSLGAVRTFQMRHRTDPGIPRRDLDLPAGSLLVMRGTTQRCWVHRVPKRPRASLAPRINLTFRRLLG